ncbi:MAG TPA: GGDEF domain-containing protein [Acidobacteriaceae bacterium]|jgi:diguanylate cyclase (GGDEF)-like protein|nr:GGDEF domain-containing protein [Acidobacteriaceae bacterium]
MTQTHQERQPSVLSGFSPERNRNRVPSKPHILACLLLLGVWFGCLTPGCFGFDRSDPTNSNDDFQVASIVWTAGAHVTHGAAQAAHLHPLIESVRFNQTSLPFEQGVTVGPKQGSLEIEFSTPPSAAPDHLRYRLFGFDADWKEADRERRVLYPHLPPGSYEFDCQWTASGGLMGSAVQSIPITVIGPYWQSMRFRSLCAVFLLFLILVLHKLRVRYLLKNAQKLQETVNLTRVELTLAAKTAGDAQEALKEQALKDGLTGLWNRKALFAMLEREIYRAQRDQLPITLVMLDLDHFKNINDTHGHLTGDQVLRESAGRLIEVMRAYDFAGRYGGEEFLIVLPSCSPHTGIQRAEDFRRAIANRPVPTSEGSLVVTCSLGVAAYNNTMQTEDLIRQADEALYRAKRQGRNCVCVGK